MDVKHKPEEYKHIQAWGIMMSSSRYYIKVQQQKAAEDNAPIDAVFHSDEGWRTYSQISSTQPRYLYVISIMNTILRTLGVKVA